ncbi:MAG TPA: Uma2 family endonuclease [Byssovorax sp.]
MDPAPVVTLGEYLAFEDASATKHELVNGQIVAMSGASIRHNAIAMNLAVLLGNALKGSRCRPSGSDQRIHGLATGIDTYPDLSIVCGPHEVSPEDRHAIVNPSVLVEILSPSTESYDRGAKWRHYQRIPSLREYVLVAGFGEPAIECFRRTDDGRWIYELVRGDDAEIALTSCGATLALADVYADAPPEE